LPEGITVKDAATLGVCGLVTYQCLVPNVKPGDRVFINGGSGGTGTFAIQIAKALGCHVTTTCSGMLAGQWVTAMAESVQARTYNYAQALEQTK
jgi:NADPH:quinone reductase-like Zn-dependent oxidoreductase